MSLLTFSEFRGSFCGLLRQLLTHLVHKFRLCPTILSEMAYIWRTWCRSVPEAVTMMISRCQLRFATHKLQT